jgi:hypothetical protein
MTWGRCIAAVLATWLAFLGVDFFFHGGLLARWYLAEPPGVLPMRAAFARIPLGYGSFLIVISFLLWVMQRAGVSGTRPGARFGTIAGLLLASASSIGLYSIVTVPGPLLFGWFCAEALEAIVAGAFLGAALGGASLKRLFGFAVIILVVCMLLVLVLQSIGYAPTMRA